MVARCIRWLLQPVWYYQRLIVSASIGAHSLQLFFSTRCLLAKKVDATPIGDFFLASSELAPSTDRQSRRQLAGIQYLIGYTFLPSTKEEELSSNASFFFIWDPTIAGIPRNLNACSVERTLDPFRLCERGALLQPIRKAIQTSPPTVPLPEGPLQRD